ncbi:MAG: Gfo/Idh/MocA family oxidoreductase [Dehalococcoidia bacterium]|nr:Gfo/Idh/MocA family oxidoreductase [Dehalococcoidia bacterium]
MPDPIRVGVIGAGGNTRSRHIPGLQAIEGVEVVVVCNRSEESGQRVADEFGISRVVTDPREVLDAADVDAVCIGTWPYRHREYTVAALEAGKHVLVEARIAMDAGEAREMLAVSRQHPDLVAQIVPSPLDFKSWRTIRRMVQDGTLGEVREAHVTILGGASLKPETPLHWRERVEYSGTNTMTLGLYIEAVHRWLGPTARVMADGTTFLDERTNPDDGQPYRIEVPDSLGVLATMESGTRVTYRVSAVTHAPVDRNGVALYGSTGTLHWQPGDRMTWAPLGEEPQPLEPDAGTAGDWRVEQDFIDSIREGKPVELTSFEDGVLYMRVTEAVARSRKEGRAVEIGEV